MARTRGFALLLLTTALFVPACGGDPPDKEIQQAQSTIDAARAAGANEYAHDELAAAELALKNARDAVGQRDYRLALAFALDSRERAQSAATEAAGQKDVARGEAQRLLTATTAALAEARGRLKAAEAARMATRVLRMARSAIADVDRAVQEARTAFGKGDYLGAVKPLIDANTRLAEATRPLENADAAPARRRS